MKAFQQRVVDENLELGLKIDRLNTFFNSAVFWALPEDERLRMARQLRCMNEYSNILDDRIKHFSY